MSEVPFTAQRGPRTGRGYSVPLKRLYIKHASIILRTTLWSGCWRSRAKYCSSTAAQLTLCGGRSRNMKAVQCDPKVRRAGSAPNCANDETNNATDDHFSEAGGGETRL